MRLFQRLALSESLSTDETGPQPDEEKHRSITVQHAALQSIKPKSFTIILRFNQSSHTSNESESAISPSYPAATAKAGTTENVITIANTRIYAKIFLNKQITTKEESKMTIFDIMPTWLAYTLTTVIALIPLAISIGIIMLIVLGIKALVKHLKK